MCIKDWCAEDSESSQFDKEFASHLPSLDGLIAQMVHEISKKKKLDKNGRCFLFYANTKGYEYVIP